MNRFTTYAQLVRLPNVFTAFADILMAALVGGIGSVRWLALVPLLAASACLYSAGMVWNDYFDLDQDTRERPFRPLPSGRVTRGTAMALGVGLMVAGLLLAVLAGWQVRRAAPVVVAVLLVAAILAYDGILKRTFVGPLAMGTCRFLNVLLGLSAAETASAWLGLHLALVIGVYVVGVTWFARTEARASRQPELVLAAAVMAFAVFLAVLVPAWLAPGTSSALYPYLLVGFSFLIGFPVCRAIASPVPARVQAAVKRSILGLVILDAVLATAMVALPVY